MYNTTQSADIHILTFKNHLMFSPHLASTRFGPLQLSEKAAFLLVTTNHMIEMTMTWDALTTVRGGCRDSNYRSRVATALSGHYIHTLTSEWNILTKLTG